MVDLFKSKSLSQTWAQWFQVWKKPVNIQHWIVILDFCANSTFPLTRMETYQPFCHLSIYLLTNYSTHLKKAFWCLDKLQTLSQSCSIGNKFTMARHERGGFFKRFLKWEVNVWRWNSLAGDKITRSRHSWSTASSKSSLKLNVTVSPNMDDRPLVQVPQYTSLESGKLVWNQSLVKGSMVVMQNVADLFPKTFVS